MADRSEKKDNHPKIARSSATDIMSNLPSEVTENILMLLPLRDAVRTSILSRKWRYKWVNLPQLVFDDTLVKDSMENDDPLLHSKLFKIIFQVLLLHNGPIVKFTLSISALKICSEIHPLMVFLSKNGIRELAIDICDLNGYRFPSSLFSCEELRQLYLSNCSFDPPLTFKGFSRITSLEFILVDFGDGVLEKLVSSCPLLERLKLEGPMYYDNLEIDAPNLKFLSSNARFKYIHFQNAPLLAVVLITSDDDEEDGKAYQMIDVFGCLPVIETLQLGRRFLKFLTVGGVPERLLFTLDHLKVLQLDEVYCREIAEVSFVLCLIKSAPNLKKLEIEMFTSKDDDTGPVLEFLEMQLYSDVSFNQLREVKMQFYSGTRPELEFIKLILAKSPMLETMLIESSKEVADNGELTRFPHVAPKVEIIRKDADKNRVTYLAKGLNWSLTEGGG
ncbi:F-box/FBD/LRR-repeat protein At1g13570-like [Cornus florida]|uniref:F-box/FBD/LRR-repeat protein At1g13570-like n=1 Tax=Cornus florida TaxID=4283 RepID=UPI00289E06F9|nr:F-box/FBD/LRR-repeat protein At1g13570-like [Cornus florida]XP_059648644.1 F-box/FBD/LRR-repeat protein At1g13570-like [Cornus florida]XP_059648645.1 F-box/FBD/LRR-repeat protein At1g13570-like [Cornus florida]XP_059648646.1 F-box/FBD/LRR-repeat protein At1g13570-like [Cornus florida]